jgi:hypothetical protein
LEPASCRGCSFQCQQRATERNSAGKQWTATTRRVHARRLNKQPSADQYAANQRTVKQRYFRQQSVNGQLGHYSTSRQCAFRASCEQLGANRDSLSAASQYGGKQRG